MAEASIVVTVTDEMPLPGKGFLVMGTLAVDAASDTYATGGLALGVAEFAGKVPVASGQAPKHLIATGIAGYVYEFKKATNRLQIRAQTNAAAEDAPLGELAASAIPAGVSGDTITFIALFDKFGSV
jgi:hypothetical protein